MALKQPESMDQLIYLTNRTLGEGKIMAWVCRQDCPKCRKAKMGKPLDPKTKKPKIRAKDYECPACGHSEEKEAYEDTLTCDILYTCPFCKKAGEASVPFQRRKVQRLNEESGKKEAVDVVRFTCGSCGKPLDITKKMKQQ